jgi:translation initiation factor 2 subunit 2
MSYDDLLKNAQEQMPESILKNERFDLPKLSVMVIGNRTTISNFVKSIKDVRREPVEVLKYFAKELATSGEIKGAQAEFIGKFSGLEINKKFTRFLDEFVLCKECHKPDTKLQKEGKQLFLKCEACGARRPVSKM